MFTTITINNAVWNKLVKPEKKYIKRTSSMRETERKKKVKEKNKSLR